MNIKSIFTLVMTVFCSVVAVVCNDDKHQEKQKGISLSKGLQSTNDGAIRVQDTIAISTAELGDFPFIGLPENTEYANKPLQRKYDELYFPINSSGKLVKVGGQVFKSDLTNTNTSEWSSAYVLKSYDEAIKSVGGAKLFEGKFTPEQVKFIKGNAAYLGEEGSLDFYNNTIHSYVIRRRDGDDVYIQLDPKYGAVQILQKKAFKQTMVPIKANQIEKELDEKGKSIVYINFDTDKATIKGEGKTTIHEIAQVLKDNPDLKLAIHGYTDNIGSEVYNQALSAQRAHAVVTELSMLGISESRLSVKGFGSKNAIADNTTPEGRSKNRRVELVKQ